MWNLHLYRKKVKNAIRINEKVLRKKFNTLSRGVASPKPLGEEVGYFNRMTFILPSEISL